MGRRGRMSAQCCRNWRVPPCVRLLGVILLAAGMALLFLCVPGWAWAALTGALLTGVGLWLATAGGC